MVYNITLFVHGVPSGQDIWGPPGADTKYIEAFYGRKSNVPSQMFLEVMQFDGETNAYYTYYYYNDKMQDKQNRIGGYFALTLRINFYYADVQNIYNLLEAAFNKYIVGSVLEYTAGGGCRFLISQLNNAEKNFIELEKELQHYLMEFSSDKDFVVLSGFKSNGQNECRTINLLEANSDVLFNLVKSNGKISVSAFYPTSKEQQIITKMNSEVQAANFNAQHQIAAAQQKAQSDVTEIKKKAQQEVQAAIKDKEQGIQAIKNEYKDADKTISQLRAKIDKANKEIGQLSSQINALNLELQNSQSYKTKYDESQKRLVKLEELVEKIKNHLSGLSGISEILGISSVGSNRQGRGGKTKEHSHSIETFIKKVHPFMDLFVMLILLCIIGIALPKSCESKGEELAGCRFPYGIDKKEAGNIQEEGQVAKSYDDKDDHQVTLDTLRERYPNARINVSNINEARGKYMQLSSGSNYSISIVGVNEDLKGEWGYNPEDFHIYDGNIIPKRAGDCYISYKVNGIVFLDRTIKVMQ